MSYLHHMPPGGTIISCALALRAHLQAHPETTRGEVCGKMYGVLTVETPDGTRGWLAAHSGLLGGRNDWPFFVPPIYDAQQPDGHFKTTERDISAINARIADMLASPQLAEARARLADTAAETRHTIDTARQQARQRKARRDALRRDNPDLDDTVRQQLIAESQHDKASLRRTVKAAEARVAQCRAAVEAIEGRMADLKRQRRHMSDTLQRWLFAQYVVLNARGERQDLLHIFADRCHALPPAGAGDCCAPKLLQWAFAHGMRPLALAELWLGAPPPTEVRRDMTFYAPCRSKCRPILAYMLQGLGHTLPGTEEIADDTPTQMPDESGKAPHNDKATGSNTTPHDGTAQQHGKLHNGTAAAYDTCATTLRTIYADAHMAVVSKPAGMLSVPGKGGRPSVESIVRERYGIDPGTPVMVHRLDMDTSGLLVVALDKAAHKALQQQFLAHTVSKRYTALLEGVPARRTDSPHVQWHDTHTGTITLPLRPDLDDRPRQLADTRHGLPAQTRFCLLDIVDGHQLVALTPVTGRTHQLRMHCAHHMGLDCPIWGDPLYGSATRAGMQHREGGSGSSEGGNGSGTAPQRMYLHAEQLTLCHPVTGRLMTFTDEAPFGPHKDK